MPDILFLAHRVPYPPDRGDKIRSFHMLKALAGLGRVHLAAFTDDAADEAHATALAPYVATAYVERRTRGKPAAGLAAVARGRPVSLSLYASAGIDRFVRKTLAERPGVVVFAFSGQMAQFVPAGVARFVMDFVDVDSAKFAAYATQGRGPMRWVHAREARLLAAWERAVAARADVDLFVSEAEAALFRAASGLGADRVRALGNGVDLAFFDPAAAAAVTVAAAAGPLIVFTGQMDYPPNVDAVSRFARHSLPAIRAAVPDARFAIVGRAAGPAVRALAALPGVTVTGAVADVRGWLKVAAVVVAPLALARGVQNKVLEAMAMARPVVVSPAAFEGIEATAGHDLIVADAAGEAGAVVALLRDPAAAARLGAAARARIEAVYGWENRLAPLADIVLPGQACRQRGGGEDGR